MLEASPAGAVHAERRLLHDGRPTPLVIAPPHPQMEVCVVIPARDEEATIGRALAHLTEQRDLDGAPLDRSWYEVIVLANNCCDGTAAAVRRFARETPAAPPIHLAEVALPASEAHVGRARRLLMDEALRRLRLLRPARGVIATTDADTRVAPTWIAATLAEIVRGAGAVGGRALLDPEERAALPRGVQQRHLRDLGYRRLVMAYESRVDPLPWDPWPRHHQHFGASFAATTEAYEHAGGLPPLPGREDDAFYQALLRVDTRFRHSPAVRVTTSARTTGRAGLGLAAQLRDWDALDRGRRPFPVESAPAIAARLSGRAELRALWSSARASPNPLAPFPVGKGKRSPGAICEAAGLLGVAPDWLVRALERSAHFGEVVEAVEAQRATDAAYQWPLVDVAEASDGLRALLERL